MKNYAAGMDGVMIDQIEADMIKRGVPIPFAVTPFTRMWWRLGVKVKPPLFQGRLERFIRLYLCYFLVIASASLIAFLIIEHKSDTVSYRLLIASISALPVAMMMMWMERNYRKQYRDQFSSWSSYVDEVKNSDQI